MKLCSTCGSYILTEEDILKCRTDTMGSHNDPVGEPGQSSLDCLIADVELVPVRSGKWLTYSSTMMECSICHRHTTRHHYNYCPHCGSKNGSFS